MAVISKSGTLSRWPFEITYVIIVDDNRSKSGYHNFSAIPYIKNNNINF